MERKFFYFKQPVAYGELNAAFDGVENALDALVVDYGINGLITGMQVLQHGAGDLTVNVNAGVAYDSNGKRIALAVLQNLNCAVDYLNVNTAVSGGGNTKVLSVFAVFERTLSDARTDGLGNTVYFEQAESFALEVHQGTEAVSPSPVALIPGKVLLADITIGHTTTTILTGAISFTRTQYYGNPAPVAAPAATGTRFSLAAGMVTSQLAAIQAQLDSTLSAGADTIKQYASIAAMRAGGAPSYTTAAVAVVPSFGLYVWAGGSGATDDGLFVVKPSSVSGNGRWLSQTSQISVTPGALPSGLPQLNGSGRLPVGFTYDYLVGMPQGVTLSGGFSTTAFANATTSWVTFTGFEISFLANAQANDVVLLNCQVALLADAANPSQQARLAIQEGGGSMNGITGTQVQVSTTSGSQTETLTAAYTVVGAGPLSITAAVQTIGDGSHNTYVLSMANFWGVIIRP